MLCITADVSARKSGSVKAVKAATLSNIEMATPSMLITTRAAVQSTVQTCQSDVIRVALVLELCRLLFTRRVWFRAVKQGGGVHRYGWIVPLATVRREDG